jgi:hypothetical protein
MPTITQVTCHPTPAAIEQPLEIDVSLRLLTAGPITVQILLDETLPYFFVAGGEQVRELSFTRTFGSSGDHTTRFNFWLGSSAPSPAEPALTIRAAGIDGSSLPFTTTVGIDP